MPASFFTRHFANNFLIQHCIVLFAKRYFSQPYKLLQRLGCKTILAYERICVMPAHLKTWCLLPAETLTSRTQLLTYCKTNAIGACLADRIRRAQDLLKLDALARCLRTSWWFLFTRLRSWVLLDPLHLEICKMTRLPRGLSRKEER